MNKICERNDCTGCLACMNICPKDAISISFDKDGLMLPAIDQDKCVDCGMCVKTCPVNNPVDQKAPTIAYAAWNLDDEKHRLSSSGGLARAMYDHIIDEGGVCYGTRFDENLDLRIVRADTRKELDEFQSSKYVQAIVGDSYRQAKNDLEKGLRVIYVGTPCQIAGLKNYLKKDYEKLIAVDLICHGVPSIKYLHDHVKFLEKKLGKSADNIRFRGLYDYKFTLFDKGKLLYSKDRWKDTYFSGFYEGLFSRPNCYSCKYACPDRVSDVTIGDFWGIGKEKPFTRPEIKGTSVVLPITDKGKNFITEISDKLYIEERSVSEAVNGNAQLHRPSEKHANYDEFLRIYREDGFEKAANKTIKKDMKKKQNEYSKLLILKWKIEGRLKRILKK